MVLPALVDLYGKSFAEPHSLNASFEYYRVLNQGVQEYQALAKTSITVPMLAIGGRGHGGMGTYETGMLRRYATNVTGKVLPDCGHGLPEECAAPLNEAVLAFLAPRYYLGYARPMLSRAPKITSLMMLRNQMERPSIWSVLLYNMEMGSVGNARGAALTASPYKGAMA